MKVQRREVKNPYSKEEMKNAFVSLETARKRRNTKKHKGVVVG